MTESSVPVLQNLCSWATFEVSKRTNRDQGDTFPLSTVPAPQRHSCSAHTASMTSVHSFTLQAYHFLKGGALKTVSYSYFKRTFYMLLKEESSIAELSLCNKILQNPSLERTSKKVKWNTAGHIAPYSEVSFQN